MFPITIAESGKIILTKIQTSMNEGLNDLSALFIAEVITYIFDRSFSSSKAFTTSAVQNQFSQKTRVFDSEQAGVRNV
jgi:hypothetical protein